MDIDRLVRFLSAAVEDRDLRVVQVAEDIFELRSANGDVIRRFTTKREVAREGFVATFPLMGIPLCFSPDREVVGRRHDRL